MINEDNLKKAIYYNKLKSINISKLGLLVLNKGNFFGEIEIYENLNKR